VAGPRPDSGVTSNQRCCRGLQQQQQLLLLLLLLLQISRRDKPIRCRRRQRTQCPSCPDGWVRRQSELDVGAGGIQEEDDDDEEEGGEAGGGHVSSGEEAGAR